MHYFPSHSFELSDWRMASGRRLRISMLAATAIVVALLSVMRLPEMRVVDPLLELIVEISRPMEAPVEDLPVPEEVQVPPAANEVAFEQTTVPVEVDSESSDTAAETSAESAARATVAERSFDWEAAKTDAVRGAVDDMEETVSVNPGFDQQRAAAATRFRASEAPVRKEIWENVEKDELGRTLLRKGDCYRVLDDPSAVNRWAFENFGQYITYCTGRKYVGKDLEWVKEIHQRFAYLRNRADNRGDVPDSD